jgi:hypothetical protein
MRGNEVAVIPDLATNVKTVSFTAIFADSMIAGGDNRNWRRRVLSIGLYRVQRGDGPAAVRRPPVEVAAR